MTYKPWPTDLTSGNQFTLAKCDPELVPEVKVTTWSNLFGDGGRVSADAQVLAKREDGTTYNSHVSLASISISGNRNVSAEREHLQSLVDEWNEDAAARWRELIEKSRAKVLAYEQKNAREAADKLARMEKGDWS